MIDQGVTTTLAACDALRSTNGDDSHNFGTGVRRTERATRECTYTNFLKCQPLPFKGIEGVASLSQWSTADQETINATTVTNAQLQTRIDQGVTATLAARDALRSTNGDDSQNSRTGVRWTERATRECTYIDFLKCQPLRFKGTEGVASLS
uniref:Reverse transcriptase domain-containing protein n=1 Tax=Tanacetum cinerariifolium TaxID=118510 RepID=A0A699S2U8_TANCI|nr:hypothetical protein [Tanacetum cinerariifolium]